MCDPNMQTGDTPGDQPNPSPGPRPVPPAGQLPTPLGPDASEALSLMRQLQLQRRLAQTNTLE